ncbi:MAG: carboxypeptidase-like regulatory domain-containing protein [Dysgonamonadaceae bacterium]|jgi:energy-converting hydrogenase Eha subunit F|nr:carboxypeptidase-like regulatory domain-containing protein [Dysgonamonadaceae bacterium]
MWLKDYIQGNKRGKEANRLEREALKDPFMQDALDGFDAIAGDHVEIIEQLEKKYTNAATPQTNRKVFLYRAIAASVLLLIGLGTYLFWERNENDIPVVAEVQLTETESIIPVDSSSEILPLPAPIEKIQQKPQQKPLIAQATKEIAPISAPAPALSPIVSEAEESISNHSIEGNLAFVEDYYFSKQAEPVVAEGRAAKLMVEMPKERIIRGRVLDETGEPLIGVSIVQKGTNTGTVTDYDGNFELQLSKGNSSKLIASYLGYKSREIKPSNTDQTVTLKPDHLALNEVVVVGYGVQKLSVADYELSKRPARVNGDSSADYDISVPVPAPVYSYDSEKNKEYSVFGEKEFQAFYLQNADKNVCDGQGATVKVSFFIDETGKPTQIEYKNFSCKEAKQEMERLLSSSPAWTKTNQKVTMTIKW